MAAKKKVVVKKAPPAKSKSRVSKVATPVAKAAAPVVISAPKVFALRVSPEGVVQNKKVDYNAEGMVVRVRGR